MESVQIAKRKPWRKMLSAFAKSPIWQRQMEPELRVILGGKVKTAWRMDAWLENDSATAASGSAALPREEQT
jgi:hypothetical protein